MLSKNCPMLPEGKQLVEGGVGCSHQECKFWMVGGCAIVIGAQFANAASNKLDMVMRHLRVPFE